MNTPAPSAAVDRADASRLRLIGFFIGLLLLAAAVVTLARNSAPLTAAAQSLSAAPPELLAAAALLPIISLLLTSVSLWLLMGRFGRVAYAEMLALVGAAWLLNYLPFWPGMIGRLAYHRTVNKIPITSSATALIWANVLNAVAAMIVGSAALLASAAVEGDDWRLALAVAVPAPLIALASVYARRRSDLPDPHLWRLLATLAVRTVEVQVWAARYAVCFALVGSPIAWGAAVALAAATQLATLIPLGGNALGWREWVTAFVAPILPVGLSLTTSVGLHTGLTAELVNRAFEIVLAIPIGLAAAAWVAARLRHSKATTPQSIVTRP
ncbi:MAG: hypothetical protein JNK58_03310 [Phycisphaerae bacterium]|nr:hypothetical protein [Phycisphaerae bacterium]